MSKIKFAKKISKIWKKFKPNLLPASLFLTLLILLFLTVEAIFSDKYYPETYIGDSNVTFLTKAQAIQTINAKFSQRASQKLTFSLNGQNFIINLASSSAKLDYQIIDESFFPTHTTPLSYRLLFQLKALFSKAQFTPKIYFNLNSQIDDIKKEVFQPSSNAQLIFDDSNIQIIEDKNGSELDEDKLQKMIEDYLIFGNTRSDLPLKVVPPKITTDHVRLAKQALESSQIEPVKLIFNQQTWTLDTKQLLAILDLSSGQNLLLDKDKTNLYLQKIASEIDQNVQEGLFDFNPATKKVSAFKPSQEGRSLNLDKTYQLITDAFQNNGSKSINLPVDIIKPKIQTSDVNSLGIKELLGQGISNFAGSIPNRIYNVNLTASKLNGILVPPGEIFSFNQTVGDITAATGFKQAYVIKEGRTVLDDGGGVCQDSTTLFRAVLNAGLPVVKRTAHAYRVGYYEQGFPAGLDATVFYPSVDFQFKNDTTAHILIQAYTTGLTLYIDLYGTSDNRVANITKPIVTNVTPPPPELRQDDPTLPKGSVKQVDWPAYGATVTFSRTVTKNGEEIINETFKSNYKAWQAIYLVGTKEN